MATLVQIETEDLHDAWAFLPGAACEISSTASCFRGTVTPHLGQPKDERVRLLLVDVPVEAEVKFGQAMIANVERYGFTRVSLRNDWYVLRRPQKTFAAG